MKYLKLLLQALTLLLFLHKLKILQLKVLLKKRKSLVNKS